MNKLSWKVWCDFPRIRHQTGGGWSSTFIYLHHRAIFFLLFSSKFPGVSGWRQLCIPEESKGTASWASGAGKQGHDTLPEDSTSTFEL